MNSLLFAVVGLMCLLTCLFVAVSTEQNLIVYKAQAVSETVTNDILTPKQYIERLSWKAKTVTR